MRGPDQPPKPTGDPDRSRPHDPDRSRPHDPDLWSRPLCFMLVGHVLFQSTEKYYSVLQSTMLGDLVNFGKIWPSRSRPRSRPFQTRSRPVPWNPRAVSIHSHVAQEEKTGLCVQCRIIWFSLSCIRMYMKWLSWFQALRSRCAEKTFYESGRSRRPDHRGTIQTRLSTHAQMIWSCCSCDMISRFSARLAKLCSPCFA